MPAVVDIKIKSLHCAALMPAPSVVPAFDAPLIIERAEILSFDGAYFARVRCGHVEGVAALNGWTPALVSLWQSVVLPFWVGRDARELENLLGEIRQHQSHYKLSGTPFWMAVAAVELAIWDALGKTNDLPVAALLNGNHKKKLPVYLSSLRRDTSPNLEVEWLSEAIAQAGAKAVKIKIGGRMECDEKTDARDAALLKRARETWGEKLVIYADANGSFGAEKAIEVGQMLENFGVAWFEEPCDWEDFEATRVVAASARIPIAGGEQDSSWPQWKWLLENCALDIAQPDLSYNGGLLRSLQVARLAAQLGVLVAPHSPKCGPQALPALHFAAALENGAPFLEWDARLPDVPAWFGTPLEIQKGAVKLPKTPGWGAIYDDSLWKRAEILASASV